LGLIAAAAALFMAGCAARAKTASATPAAVKPAAPAAPAAPVVLSTPQTTAELPKPQPIDTAAWETVPPPPADTSAAKPPVVPPPKTPRPTRIDAAPPPPVAPAEPPRPEFQEVISATDLKRLQESVANRKREVSNILEQVQKRRLTTAQRIVRDDIRGLLKLSEDYEKRNELPQADSMAERAQILARQLLNGK
jgi:hypothetical protein